MSDDGVRCTPYRGYAGLALHAVGGFALLTVYKIIRGATERRDPEE